MSDTNQPFALAGVSLFVMREGKFLMLKRTRSHGEGTWALPGGKIDFGETISQTAARECFEEAGIAVDPADIRIGPVTNDIFHAQAKHFIGVFCSVDMPAGQDPFNAEPEKATEIAWFDFGSLPDRLFTPIHAFLSQPLRPPFTAVDSRPASDFEDA